MLYHSVLGCSFIFLNQKFNISVSRAFGININRFILFTHFFCFVSSRNMNREINNDPLTTARFWNRHTQTHRNTDRPRRVAHRICLSDLVVNQKCLNLNHHIVQFQWQISPHFSLVSIFDKCLFLFLFFSIFLSIFYCIVFAQTHTQHQWDAMRSWILFVQSKYAHCSLFWTIWFIFFAVDEFKIIKWIFARKAKKKS